MKRPTLLVTRPLPQPVLNRLQTQFDMQVHAAGQPLSREQLAHALQTFDAISPTITDKFDADLLCQRPLVTRIIANFGAGFEHIDVIAAKQANIAVSNTPDALTDATAEIALLLIMMVMRRASEGERMLRAGAWAGWAPTQLLGSDAKDKTLGLIGFGRIARELARRARAALGVKIAYFSRTRASFEIERELQAKYHGSLEELLSTADMVSLHVPGGDVTRHLINANTLSLMKPSSILINTARGSVVDESALIQALNEKRIAAAGLDVYAHEPLVSSPLMALENVVLLPHLGSATVETRTAMGMQMADNLEAFFSGKSLPNRVA
jgi:lactate dehydrogenase-like 2-hydroxyacid dehydrogenase